MPIYKYVCSLSGNRFTKLQPMSAPRDGNGCPECGTTQTRRVFSTFATSGCGDENAAVCGPAGSPLR